MMEANRSSPPPSLCAQARRVPKWLTDFRPGDPFPRRAFFDSRILFYPGSGTDGHPIRYFGISHAVHCFLYADYQFPQQHVVEQMLNGDHPEHPRGYQVIECRPLTDRELAPRGWIPHLPPPRPGTMFANSRPPEGPFAQWAVLEREPDLGEEHGPQRWALLHVGVDAIAAFDALFCQGSRRLPYAVLLVDHGYGGNYTHFGGDDSPLWQLIRGSGHRPPEWVMARRLTKMWPGYGIEKWSMHDMGRDLYRLAHPHRRGMPLRGRLRQPAPPQGRQRPLLEERAE